MTMDKWWWFQGHELYLLLALVFRCFFPQIEFVFKVFFHRLGFKKYLGLFKKYLDIKAQAGKALWTGRFPLNILPAIFTWVDKMDFQYRLPGKHGKEQYHLALLDLHKNYGPLVREVFNTQKKVQRISLRNGICCRWWGKKWSSMCLTQRTFKQCTGENTVYMYQNKNVNVFDSVSVKYQCVSNSVSVNVFDIVSPTSMCF